MISNPSEVKWWVTEKPDYAIRTAEGLVPIEVKSRACGQRGLYEGEAALLVAYCLLVEDVLGEPVPYGVLQYADREVRVAFTDRRREKLLGVLEEMRGAEEAGAKCDAREVARSHRVAARCRACGFRAECNEQII